MRLGTGAAPWRSRRRGRWRPRCRARYPWSRSAPGATRARPWGSSSRWVDGLERALLDEEIDLAVHSAKDVPAQLADGLELLGVPPRQDPRDALVGRRSLGDLPAGARIGTTSLRRRAAVLAARADLEVVDLRGNVDTRLRKLADGEVDALVLALAGLRRLGRARKPAPCSTPA